MAISKHWTGRSGNVGLPVTHPLRTWGTGNGRIGSWAGVSVAGHRVTGLDLRVGRNAAASRISGPLPTQLGDLTSLRHLHLSGNKLKGSIPEELGDLTDLKQLYLDGNNLTGSIPEELGDLTDLKQLHLDGNKLTGSIPEELGDLTDLSHLSLSGNKLTGSIPEELGDLTSLSHLSLNGNELTGSIPEELGDLTSLSHLSLNGNEFTGSIPEELGDLTSLKQLHLNGNGLTGSIPEELGDLSSLKHLHLNGNGLTGSIPEELGDITGLTHLYLNDNQLTGSIPEELGDLTSLKHLHLNGNGLTGSIPEDLGDLTGLTHLYLDGNELRGLVPQELGDLAGLKHLHLSGNQLSGSVPEDLGDLSPSQGGSLARLFICRNMLSVTLPAALRSVEGDASTCAPAPAGLEATAGDGQVTLSWTYTGNRGIRGYQYRVCEPGGVSCGAWANIPGIGASSDASYVADELENGRDYLFQLRGVNGSGPGMSAEVAARPGLPKPPTAEAGDNQTVEEGATVTLDGSGSSDPEEEALTYRWTQTGGTAVTLSSSTAQSPTFTAPGQLVENAILVFSLVVTDAGGLASPADKVTVTVTAGPNDAPTAEAGDDQTVEEEAAVTLDGSGSSDPEEETLTYAWTKTSGPAVTLSSSAAQSPTFTAPEQLAKDATLVFSLVVTDARGLASSVDRVTVTVTAGPNDAPTAEAGDDQTVSEGATVTLDGSGSSDPEGEALRYRWTQWVRGSEPAVTLSSSTAQSPTFTAPDQLVENVTLVFFIQAIDLYWSSVDKVTVTVTAGPNDAPTAEAGQNQTVGKGATVTLDGSGSSDPEEEALTYAWTQTGGTTVTLSSSTAESPTFTVPTQVANPTLVFSLVVTDARSLASSADTVTVTVNDPPTADAGVDRTVVRGSSVTLDGSGSSDPDNDPLTYSWEQTSGTTTVTLSNANAAKASFTAPSALGKYGFELTVSDRTRSATDSVVITVIAPIIIYTYYTDTFYRRGTSKPSAPTANTGTPSGWSTTDPGPTSTEGVYSVVRTQTLTNRAVTSASYGKVTLVSGPTPDDDTATQTFYALAESAPSAPSAQTGTPGGWSTSKPSPTATQGVYSVTRTQTLRNGTVTSASYGNVTKVSDPHNLRVACEETTKFSGLWGSNSKLITTRTCRVVGNVPAGYRVETYGHSRVITYYSFDSGDSYTDPRNPVTFGFRLVRTTGGGGGGGYR